MGRKRIHHTELPRGVYFSRGSFFHRGKHGTWLSLGKDKERALVRHQEIKLAEQGWSATKHKSFVSKLWSAARKRATKRGLAFNLTVEEVAQMIERCDGRCPMTGIAFDYNRVEGKRARPWIPSLDRIDPALGYTRENTRIVCAYVNMALNEFGVETLRQVKRLLLKRPGNFRNPKITSGASADKSL